MLVLFSLFSIFAIIYPFVNPISDFVFSLLFVVVYTLALINVWSLYNKKLTLSFLFLLTFGIFIGGRFWAAALGCDLEVFAPTFFYSYIVDYTRKNEVFCFVILFIFFFVLGIAFDKYYSLTWQYKEHQKNICNYDITRKKIDVFLNFLFPFLFLMLLYLRLKSFVNVVSNGYLALYSSQGGEYTGANFLFTLSPICLGLAMAYGNKKNRIKYLLLFLINSLLQILMGSRGMFGAFILFLIWIYSVNHRITLKKLFLLFLSSLFVLLFVFSFSVRYVNSDSDLNVSILDSITSFLYSQGISLMVFDASRLIDEYPLLPYFQSLFPGVSFVYNLFFDGLMSYETSFASYLSNTLNPFLFGVVGQGLGWTILSDVYLYSGKNVLFFLMISFLLGMLLSKLDNNFFKSVFCRYLAYTISIDLFILPRAGINTIVPLLVYSLLIYGFVKYIIPVRKI